MKPQTILSGSFETGYIVVLKNEVTHLPKEKKTSTWHGGTDGDYYCDNCDDAMLPSEIAYQNYDNKADAFCSISCLKIHAHCNNY